MKKFFTSLLALVGMVAGFTLTSCGGGGGGGDEIGPNLEGLEFQVAGKTPAFDIFIIERRGKTNNYTCQLRLGDAQTGGSFSLDPGYPSMTDNGQEVKIKGRLGFDSGKFLIDMRDAAQFFNFPSNSSKGCALLELIVEMTFQENGSGAISYTGKGYGYDSAGNPEQPSEEEQEKIDVDGPYYPIDVNIPGGLSVTGPINRLFDN